MDKEGSPSRVPKRRGCYTPAFKERILAECLQPGESVATVTFCHSGTAYLTPIDALQGFVVGDLRQVRRVRRIV